MEEDGEAPDAEDVICEKEDDTSKLEEERSTSSKEIDDSWPKAATTRRGCNATGR